VTDVHLPTRDESLAIELEVVVHDRFGNEALESVPLNVDVDPPSEPTLTTDAPVPPAPVRDGQNQLSWATAPSRDDDSGDNGPVDHYELRAVAVGETAAWNTDRLLTTLDGATTAVDVDHLGLDRTWRLTLQAFDEAGNASALTSLSEVDVSTELRAIQLDTMLDFAGNGFGLAPLGDVNGDDRDDLIVHRDGAIILLLGESTPSEDSGILIEDAAAFFGSSVTPVGDVNGDTLDDFLVGAWGDCAVYLFFGDADTDELVDFDVRIEGRGFGSPDGCPNPDTFTNFTGMGMARSGGGNFADIEGEGAFNDLYFATMSFGDANFFPRGDIYIVLGRDWSTLPLVDGGDPTGPRRLAVVGDEDGVGDPDGDNCLEHVITIYGENPPSMPEALRPEPGTDAPLFADGFGFSAGLVDLNADSFADLVVSTDYVPEQVGDPLRGVSVQYIFYGDGERAGDCGLGARDLSVTSGGAGAGEPDGAFLVSGVSASSQALDVRIAVNDGGPELAVGSSKRDRAELYRAPADYDDRFATTAPPTDLGGAPGQFARSVWFAGDVDLSGAMDLVVGSPAGEGYSTGRVYVVFGALGEGAGAVTFPATASTGLEVFDGTTAVGHRFTGGILIDQRVGADIRDFGTLVTGGFDYNGDGVMDIAAASAGPAEEGPIWLYY
jgi:hypothetical protein